MSMNQAYAIPTAMRRAPQARQAGLLQQWVGLLFRLMDRQRQRRKLLELDAHMLNDIGVSQRQALEEGRKPFWR